MSLLKQPGPIFCLTGLLGTFTLAGGFVFPDNEVVHESRILSEVLSEIRAKFGPGLNNVCVSIKDQSVRASLNGSGVIVSRADKNETTYYFDSTGNATLKPRSIGDGLQAPNNTISSGGRNYAGTEEDRIRSAELLKLLGDCEIKPNEPNTVTLQLMV